MGARTREVYGYALRLRIEKIKKKAGFKITDLCTVPFEVRSCPANVCLLRTLPKQLILSSPSTTSHDYLPAR